MMEDLRPNLVGVGNLLGSNFTPPSHSHLELNFF